MKHFLLASLVVLTLLASGCQVQPKRPSATQPAVAAPLNTTTSATVQLYDDVRQRNDLRSTVAQWDADQIATLWYNETNVWPQALQDVAHGILEKGMNPGLGIRGLHAQGITGQGVTVAIIDQNMFLDHPEFAGKIVQYKDVGTKTPADAGSMHGPAVTSLLVGNQIGTAPGARVYYAAAPSWTGDAQYYADALNWIVDESAKLSADAKIRAVSVSAAPSGPGSPFDKNNAAWDAAYKRATEAGILVLDCTSDHHVTAPCYCDLDDPDNFAKCQLGWPGKSDYLPFPTDIHIPSSYRTQAEEYRKGQFSYQYTGRGGSSWSVPYLTGVLAMGWQLRPDLTGAQMLDLIFQTAYVSEGGAKIINPPAFIEAVQKAG